MRAAGNHGGGGMPVEADGRERRRLGEVLVDAGVIDEGQLQTALAQRAPDRGERLGQTVARLGYASDEEIARALAKQFHLDFGTARIGADPTAAAAIPESLARRRRVVPLGWEDDRTFRVACVDPMDVVALDDARLAVGARALRRVVVTPATLEDLHERVFGSVAGELLEGRPGEDAQPEQRSEVEEAPIVRLAERLLQEALTAGASDVHLDPGEDGTLVRYRIDGVLRPKAKIPSEATASLLNHVKVLAQMDITERRLPQDGRMQMRVASGDIDVRASTLPTLHGETLVLRLLPRDDQQLGIGDLGFDDDQRAMALGAIARPQGLVLLTGPTGSGKTSTMYALLRELAAEPRKIVTLEDPVEYEIGGVSQAPINPRAGLTFARSLRTVLRQDPDVVMVGEIRDSETAELALQASLTGHLVLSTLHTNDAPSAVVRLRDLGAATYLVADALTAVIAQRLVRKLCASCARPATADDRARYGTLAADDGLAMPVGCRECGHSGYRGRTGVFEILACEGEVRERVGEESLASALRQAALRGGMTSLRAHGLEKARDGITSLPEILRVTPEDERGSACPDCGQDVEPDFAHCPWCGHDLQPASCGACGRELRPGWHACPECGQRQPTIGAS